VVKRSRHSLGQACGSNSTKWRSKAASAQRPLHESKADGSSTNTMVDTGVCPPDVTFRLRIGALPAPFNAYMYVRPFLRRMQRKHAPIIASQRDARRSKPACCAPHERIHTSAAHAACQPATSADHLHVKIASTCRWQVDLGRAYAALDIAFGTAHANNGKYRISAGTPGNGSLPAIASTSLSFSSLVRHLQLT
jgi:hypothetical protein